MAGPSKSKQKAPKSRAGKDAAIITDPRFKNIHTDPRFRLPSAKSTHVTLDKRFAHMLRDDDFATKASVDRYGRKVGKDAGQKELKRFYRVEDEDKDDEEDEEDDREEDDDDEVERELAKAERNYDPAREGGFSSSEDDSDSDSDEDELAVEDTAEVEFPQGKSEHVPMGEISRRLAVVNLDWDNIRAADLMAVATSFAPADGRILNVTVYPSEFGRERMEREELEGPPKEIFANARKAEKAEDSDSDSELDEDEDEEIKKNLLKEDTGEEFDSTALRSYQLERLRYFYAVITASSPAAAKSLYDAMDGREYLSSANFFDLRFIPDDVSFDDDKPRDSCDRVPDGYKPSDFVTDALTHSRVKLTWDADDTQRKEVQKRAFSQKEINDNDLMAYVGSDSESSAASEDEEEIEEEEEEAAAHAATDGSSKKKTKEDKAAKLRAALGLSSSTGLSSKKSKSDAPVGDMQVTFTSGVSANNKKGSVFENEPVTEETTREKYIRKEKERKARRKEKAKAARDGVEITFDDAAATTTTTTEPANNDNDNTNTNTAADPFNDPFFDDPVATSRAAAKAARAADKAKRATERRAADAAAAQERAQLELLMADEDAAANGGRGLKHFDLREIERAEKAERRGKKGKGRKGGRKGEGEGEGEGEGKRSLEDGFEMDTQDPRFRGVFESHEYAIDPTNPRFKGTKGMRALLEEGRRKRKGGREGEGEGEEVVVKRAKKSDGGGAGADDLKRLVERVKGKTKKN